MTALSFSSAGSAVVFSVLNIEEAVGDEGLLLNTTVVCSPERSSSVVGKAELVSGATDASPDWSVVCFT